jgi:hypothetical protein
LGEGKERGDFGRPQRAIFARCRESRPLKENALKPDS